ncbi:MAG: hypothetical protein P8016_14340 [Sedimentisphaerales bacterium]
MNEIHANYASGNTLYLVVRDGEGNVWYPDGQVFESWGTSGRTAQEYCLDMADKSGSLYVGAFDDNICAGRYNLQIFLQGGVDPADSDSLIESREFVWSGTGRITSDKLLANKAVQDKSTGKIRYYDDDAQTVLLTLTPFEDSEALTRACS